MRWWRARSDADAERDAPKIDSAAIEARQRRESTPPADERVELHCTFIAEAYLASHASRLYAGMEELGWDRPDWDVSTPAEWVRETRQRGAVGGFCPVGPLVREGWAG